LLPGSEESILSYRLKPADEVFLSIRILARQAKQQGRDKASKGLTVNVIENVADVSYRGAVTRGNHRGLCGCGLEQNMALWALNKSILNTIIDYGLEGPCLPRN